MTYEITLDTVQLTSSWRCAYQMVNGTLQWVLVSSPSAASKTITFPVELPANAVVSRAVLQVSFGSSPLTGAAYRRVNGTAIPADGIVQLTGITADTTTWDAEFTFRANGAIYQDTNLHSAVLELLTPTLTVEYDIDESAEPDDPDAPTPPEYAPATAHTGSARLPRLLRNGQEVARLLPIKLSIDLNLDPLSSAQMDLPEDQPEVLVRDFLELYSPDGSVGIFRATETEGGRYGGGIQKIWLQHGLCTLSDDILPGNDVLTAPIRQLFATLLNAQTVVYWQLGDCDIPEDVEMVYQKSYENLLSAFTSCTAKLPDGYAWETDQTVFPWLLHLRAMPDDDACECRLTRNLQSATVTVETSNLCTRVYAFGAGDGGTDRLTLEPLLGQPYIDAESAGTWGIVSRTITSDEIYDALTLQDVAERYLSKYSAPMTSIKLDAFDLYTATGEPFDRFWLGRVCRVPMPQYGTVIRERVVAIRWPDVFGSPEGVEVTLANRLRDASDEIAELLRDATSGKLIGGTVEAKSITNNNEEVEAISPMVTYFDLTGYGNVLSLMISYTAKDLDTGDAAKCNVSVDGNPVPTTLTDTGTFEAVRYLGVDEAGVPPIGQHNVSIAARGQAYLAVSATITIKTIEKR